MPANLPRYPSMPPRLLVPGPARTKRGGERRSTKQDGSKYVWKSTSASEGTTLEATMASCGPTLRSTLTAQTKLAGISSTSQCELRPATGLVTCLLHRLLGVSFGLRSRRQLSFPSFGGLPISFFGDIQKHGLPIDHAHAITADGQPLESQSPRVGLDQISGMACSVGDLVALFDVEILGEVLPAASRLFNTSESCISLLRTSK